MPRGFAECTMDRAGRQPSQDVHHEHSSGDVCQQGCLGRTLRASPLSPLLCCTACPLAIWKWDFALHGIAYSVLLLLHEVQFAVSWIEHVCWRMTTAHRSPHCCSNQAQRGPAHYAYMPPTEFSHPVTVHIMRQTCIKGLNVKHCSSMVYV